MKYVYVETRAECDQLMLAYKALGWKAGDIRSDHHPDNYADSFYPRYPVVELSENFTGWPKVIRPEDTLSLHEALVELKKMYPENPYFNSPKPQTFMTNLISKFKLLTKSEPERTFQKAGVTDSNDVLTSEGRDLFQAFLLNKHGKEFKEEVVDKLLEEQEKEKEDK